MSEPIRATWAEGRRKAGLTMVLFWLGAASVFASAIIGLQLWAVPRTSEGISPLALFIPAWGMVAMGLAVLGRKNGSGLALKLLSFGWLLVAAVFMTWVRFNHA